MIRSVLLTLLLAGLGGMNVVLQAQCEKCCGGHTIEDTAHRNCDEEAQTGWCHVTGCASAEICGACWAPDRTIDICSGFGSGEWGYLGLIRFGGHLSCEGYDVQTDGRHTEATSASPVH